MEISVYPGLLKRSAGQLTDVKGCLNSSADIIRSAADALGQDSETYAGVISKLRTYSRDLDRLSGRIADIGTGGVEIAALYENADNCIAGIEKSSVDSSNGHGMAGSAFGGGGEAGGRGDDGWSLMSANVSASSGIVSASLSLKFLEADAEAGLKSEWDIDEGEVWAGASAKAGVTLLQLKGENSIGLLHSETEINVGRAEAEGKLGASLMKDGRFDPSIDAKVKAEAVGLEGKAEVSLGNDEYDVHASADGKVGYASAEAEFKAGTDGITVSAGAEAYAAKGELKGGFTLFGIKVDASIEGKAGGAGVGASADVGQTSAEGYIGAGLLLGAGVKIKIDWKNFKLF